ncbi:uncharacterized protein XM38_020180 [Halomicronema hongdechloris C2206]|uniref:Uncharacterized protein n=1 Tax=Halomicronema hongdechloris C2206 TaxID=1641165 RepID=A0A1Z3HLA1_9CYAN|nr:hypothetical protein [Halomicronema hongdechloris]ASC71068.1 uncharacterized protein XM38_020180 [Halomicronema hongdechloris C2206]
MTIQVAQPPLYSASETKSTNILGPAYFELCDLRVAGTAGQPDLPMQVAPAQSPYIVASNEQFSVSVDVKYNNTPLTRLLLCLGLKMEVHFAFEGIGGKAIETDASVSKITVKDDFTYTLTWTGTPDMLGLTKGLYGIAAIISVSPADHPCSQDVIGYGYVAARLMQVFPA